MDTDDEKMTDGEDGIHYCDRLGVAEIECATRYWKEQPSDIDCMVCAQLRLSLAITRAMDAVTGNAINIGVNRV